MSFEFGMFHEFQRRNGQTDAEAFAESFAQVDAAERGGLDVMWLAELHVAPERSVLAAPLAVASAIAVRTKHMKIGIAVQVLPLCHPLRLAEEVATVDHISQGRLIFGLDAAASRAPTKPTVCPMVRAESALRKFSRSLTRLDGRAFLLRGPLQVSRTCTWCRSRSSGPHPPIRIAATSAAPIPASATLGFPIFVAVRLGRSRSSDRNIKAYREAYALRVIRGAARSICAFPSMSPRRSHVPARSQRNPSCISTAR